jgi:hypothetical protein
MADEVTNINEIKQTSDGSVKITVETYNDLLKKANRPTEVIVNKTEVIKTAAILAQECRLWGGGLMALGASMFVVGAVIYKHGRV